MIERQQWLHGLVFTVALLCWLGVLGAMLLRIRAARGREVKRDPSWKLGLLLQSASIAVVFTIRRPLFTPFALLGAPCEIALAVLAAALAVTSAGMLLAALRTLGLHWTWPARLVEGHRLVTQGPYRLVRHPIYTALFGLSLATALANSRWTALGPFVVAFLIGTAIRVRGEDRLLREAFGTEFEAYARRVPALVPRLR
jgi:protein-S-isoprenylcysteine O-methyltransferase Ste14